MPNVNLRPPHRHMNDYTYANTHTHSRHTYLFSKQAPGSTDVTQWWHCPACSRPGPGAVAQGWALAQPEQSLSKMSGPVSATEKRKPEN